MEHRIEGSDEIPSKMLCLYGWEARETVAKARRACDRHVWLLRTGSQALKPSCKRQDDIRCLLQASEEQT